VTTSTAPRPIRHPLDPRNPLAGVYIAIALFELAEGALRFLVPLNLNRNGLGPELIGLIIFVFSLTSLLSRGAAAAIYRPGRARLMIVGAGIASTIAYLFTPFVDDPVLFAALMAFDGFGWGVATTSLLATMMVVTPRSITPAVAMGWYVGFQGVAFALATTVGGLLAELAGIQIAMVVLATMPVMAAVLIAVRLPRREEPGSADVGALLDGLEAADLDEPIIRRHRTGMRHGVHVARKSLRGLPLAVWVAALVAAYLNIMNGLLQSFFPLLGLALGLSIAQIGTLSSIRSAISAIARFGAGWLFSRVRATRLHLPLLGLALGLSIAQIGTLSSIRSAISAIARFGAGWLFSRVRATRLHLPLLAVSAATLALIPSAGSYLLNVPLFAMNGVSRGLLRVTSGAAAMESTRRDQAGLTAAVMTAGLDVGKMIGPLIGGIVAAAIGLDWMFRTVPLAFLLVMVALVVLGGRHADRSAAQRRGPNLTG